MDRYLTDMDLDLAMDPPETSEPKVLTTSIATALITSGRATWGVSVSYCLSDGTVARVAYPMWIVSELEHVLSDYCRSPGKGLNARPMSPEDFVAPLPTGKPPHPFLAESSSSVAEDINTFCPENRADDFNVFDRVAFCKIFYSTEDRKDHYRYLDYSLASDLQAQLRVFAKQFEFMWEPTGTA